MYLTDPWTYKFAEIRTKMFAGSLELSHILRRDWKMNFNINYVFIVIYELPKEKTTDTRGLMAEI